MYCTLLYASTYLLTLSAINAAASEPHTIYANDFVDPDVILNTPFKFGDSTYRARETIVEVGELSRRWRAME